MTQPPKEALPVVEYIRRLDERPYPSHLDWGVLLGTIAPLFTCTEESWKAFQVFMRWIRKTDPQVAMDLIWGERKEG